jgi:hypothetical protein
MAPCVGKDNIFGGAQYDLGQVQCSDLGVVDLGCIQNFKHRSSDVKSAGVPDMEHHAP